MKYDTSYLNNFPIYYILLEEIISYMINVYWLNGIVFPLDIIKSKTCKYCILYLIQLLIYTFCFIYLLQKATFTAITIKGHFYNSNKNTKLSLEMPEPSQGHYGFHSFPVVD
jgi:hypothetical protein